MELGLRLADTFLRDFTEMCDFQDFSIRCLDLERALSLSALQAIAIEEDLVKP